VSGEIRDGQTIRIDADPNGAGLIFQVEARPVNLPEAVTV
jgi:hypothetical protein